MITLEYNRLVFRFPEVHEDAVRGIEFQRTLRIPDDGNDYSLPPGLGNFPLRHLDDYAKQLPKNWLSRGGVIMPMHQAEAMWINFMGRKDYPCAVKIAMGKICAITGNKWVNHLNGDPQDYLVLPQQPWLDGYCVKKGVIRQFVAMPLNEGYSAEEQITGAAKHGGIQIAIYPMKAERFERIKAERQEANRLEEGVMMQCRIPVGMGLAPGGRMKQNIYEDPYGLKAWDQRNSSRCFVSIANSTVWTSITKEYPPTEPPTAKQYTNAGLPWFDYYDGDAEALAGAEKFGGLVNVADMSKEKGKVPLPENESVGVKRIIELHKRVLELQKHGAVQIREMSND